MDEWLRQAQALPLNRQKKILHCGSSPSLSVKNTLKGWTGYCHRCGEKFYEARSGLLSVADLQAAAIDQRQKPQLPSDFSRDYADDSLTSSLWMTWLARASITQRLRDVYSIGWSNRFRKAVLPVYSSTGELESLIYRKVHKEDNSPKYVIQSVDPEAAVFLSNLSTIGEHSLRKPVSTDASANEVGLVITEDMLSAMRVGTFLPSGSLLGTSINGGKVERMLRHSCTPTSTVGIWLDPDKAGLTAATKLERRLALMGIPHRRIQSSKDPKLLSDREIARCLYGDRCNPIADYEA